MRRPERKLFRMMAGKRNIKESPDEKLKQLRDTIGRVFDLPIKKAEEALGVKDYADKSEHSGYLSPLIYRRIKLKRGK